jgi:hypothetical protein
MAGVSTDIPTFMITTRSQVDSMREKINTSPPETHTDIKTNFITCELLYTAASAPAFLDRQNQAYVKNLPHSPKHYQLVYFSHS